jgi:hypothetical protein
VVSLLVPSRGDDVRLTAAGFRMPTVEAGALALPLLWLLLSAPKVGAQITPADTMGMNYPGWESADQVAPRITVETSYDSVSGLWTYRYTIANDASARQAIWSIDFGLDPLAAPSRPLTAAAPPGWKALVYPYSQAALLPGATFFALYADDSLGPASGPPPARIPPGQSLSGFVVTSPYPPGYARSYVQGYVQLPAPPEDRDPIPPNDTTNSQRGLTIFPNQYIITPSVAPTDASAAAGARGLLRTMIPSPSGKGVRGMTLRGSVPIAVTFAAPKGKVQRATFRATLNGVEVTRAFHPAQSGGADFAAVFRRGTSPLVAGQNRLVATVEGVDPRTGRSTIDTSELRFTVRP